MTDETRPSWLQRLNRFGWIRLGTANFRAPLDELQQRRALHRLVKVIDADTIELRNFGTSKRWIWLFVAVLVIGGWFWTRMSMNIPILPKPLLGLFAPEYYGEWITRSYESLSPDGKFPPDFDRAGSVAISAQSARDEWRSGIFFLILFAFPPLYWLFAPAPRGVRVDRKRRLIYGWKWFRFHCAPIRSPDLEEIEGYIVGVGPFGARDYAHGHLVYALPRVSDPRKTRDFHLGRGPTPIFDQFSLMHDAAASFLYHKQDPGWLTDLKTGPRGPNGPIDWLAAFTGFHLIPGFWPRSTQRRLDRIAAHGGKGR